MKKELLLLTVFIASIAGVKAQAPDMGLETWVNAPGSTTVQDPTGWASFNALTHPFVGMAQTVFKETGAPPTGTTAAKVVTEVIPSSVAVPNPLVPVPLPAVEVPEVLLFPP